MSPNQKTIRGALEANATLMPGRVRTLAIGQQSHGQLATVTAGTMAARPGIDEEDDDPTDPGFSLDDFVFPEDES
jgi:hypothetical protein